MASNDQKISFSVKRYHSNSLAACWQAGISPEIVERISISTKKKKGRLASSLLAKIESSTWFEDCWSIRLKCEFVF